MDDGDDDATLATTAMTDGATAPIGTSICLDRGDLSGILLGPDGSGYAVLPARLRPAQPPRESGDTDGPGGLDA